MIKTIVVGGEPTKFEATTGTGELYQMFTGRNIYADLQEVSKAFVGINMEDTSKLPMDGVNKILKMVQQMGFVMYIQANTRGDTPLDRIRNIKSRINDDEYLAWILEIEQDEFNNTLFLEFIDLMNLNSKSSSESKN